MNNKNILIWIVVVVIILGVLGFIKFKPDTAINNETRTVEFTGELPVSNGSQSIEPPFK